MMYRAGLLAVGLMMLGGTLAVAEPPDDAAGPIAAHVGQEPIYARDVARAVHDTAGDRQINPAMRSRFEAQMLERLVDQQLVRAYLLDQQLGASREEVDKAIETLKSRLAARSRKLDDLLEARSLTEAQFRREIAWQTSWRKYLGKHLTDEALAAYFEAHRREFDGTQVAASHLLLLSGPEDAPGSHEARLKKAVEIRKEIVAGQLTFEEAARKYSEGPSSKDGGDLGYFPRRGVMIEPFSRAAFALERNGISQPVPTRFGVHLIQVTDVKPGKKKWTDVRGPLREAVAASQFNEIARQQRERTKVKFTGATSYVDPETGKLIVSKESE